MNRVSVNPVEWGLQFSIDQGEITEGGRRHLRCSGQFSAVPDAEAELGFRVVAPNEMRGQMECVLGNIDDILAQAEMTRRDIVAARFLTTDIDSFLENYDLCAGWIANAGMRPSQSVIGVARLVLDNLIIQIEVEAAA